MVSGGKRKISFIWHGGEPLLWGIENYKQVFEFIKSEFCNSEIKNSIQCNLSLMNDEYIELIHSECLLMGAERLMPLWINWNYVEVEVLMWDA